MAYTVFYNRRRSQMERDYLPQIRQQPDEVTSLSPDQIEVKSFVGGLVNLYERIAT